MSSEARLENDRRPGRFGLLTAIFCFVLAGAAPLFARDHEARRDPKQPIDQEYTDKIQKYTTEPYFTSPLVNYLPASKTVPTPKAVLGDVAGAPGILPYSSDVYKYMRMLEKASPRVKVFSIGHTEEGREMIAVAVSSETNLAHLDENRAPLGQACRSANDSLGRWRGRPISGRFGAHLLHHGNDSLGRNRRADGADGAGLPAGG